MDHTLVRSLEEAAYFSVAKAFEAGANLNWVGRGRRGLRGCGWGRRACSDARSSALGVAGQPGAVQACVLCEGSALNVCGAVVQSSAMSVRACS